MNEWMNDWIQYCVWLSERMHGKKRIHEGQTERMNEWMNGMNKWVNAWMKECMNECMNDWIK